MTEPVLSIVMPFAASGARAKREIDLALRALTMIDEYEIKQYRLPWLYQSGVRWRREVCLVPSVRETCERFLSARKLLQEKFGDCDDLAAYRAAELRVKCSERAKAVCRRSPGIGWHCVVLRASGKIEDPSKRLGMKGAA